MRATVLALGCLALVLGCAAPGDLPADSTSSHPIVGHVRMRGRTIDLTVDAVDARGGEPELRRATARTTPVEIWAGTDERYVDRDEDR